jgi:hypothetical protein
VARECFSAKKNVALSIKILAFQARSNVAGDGLFLMGILRCYLLIV